MPFGTITSQELQSLAHGLAHLAVETLRQTTGNRQIRRANLTYEQYVSLGWTHEIVYQAVHRAICNYDQENLLSLFQEMSAFASMFHAELVRANYRDLPDENRGHLSVSFRLAYDFADALLKHCIEEETLRTYLETDDILSTCYNDYQRLTSALPEFAGKLQSAS